MQAVLARPKSDAEEEEEEEKEKVEEERNEGGEEADRREKRQLKTEKNRVSPTQAQTVRATSPSHGWRCQSQLDVFNKKNKLVQRWKNEHQTCCRDRDGFFPPIVSHLTRLSGRVSSVVVVLLQVHGSSAEGRGSAAETEAAPSLPLHGSRYTHTHTFASLRARPNSPRSL